MSAQTSVTFSKATLEDILSRFSIKAQDSLSTTNKTPMSVRTTMSSLKLAYIRVFGTDPEEDYGDLTWLTLENLQQPSKSPRYRPLFEGAASPEATGLTAMVLAPGTVRKNLENFRSVLYAAAQHLKSTTIDESTRDALMETFNEAYMAMGRLSAELMDAETDRLATREPSERQQARWVPWQDLKSVSKTVVQYLDGVFRESPESMNITENKKVQRSILFAMYMLIPPMRNNFTGLRFIDEGNDTADELKASGSPNYVLFRNDGTVEIVINRYKIDGRSRASDYDPERDFEANSEATKRFPLVADPTLTKFGFDPVKLSALLTNYRALQQRIVGARNRYEYLFFEVKRATNLSTAQNVEVVSAEGMSTRMTRITKRLVDQPLGAQMFRTIFLSWFDAKRPSMAQRKTIASWMMHNVKTQLGT